MKAEIDAIKALIEGVCTTYFVEVPEKPVYPYVLLWTSGGRPSLEQNITGSTEDIDDTVGITSVAGTPDGVLIVQAAVRAALFPGGLPRQLAIDGRVATLVLVDSRPILVDRDVKITATGRFVSYGVDLCRLVSTPA